jgi:hypothetical protein
LAFTIPCKIEAASTETVPIEIMSSRENLRLADLRWQLTRIHQRLPSSVHQVGQSTYSRGEIK